MRTLIALSLGVALAAQDASEPKKLDLELLLELESVRGPQLSPDGKHIVFSRSWPDKVNDRSTGELWIMNADGTRQRTLTEGGSARWSPDGTRIAFTKSGKPRGSQIHVMWVDTREVTQITRLDQSPSNLRWSPDGTQIAFAMQVPEKDGFPIKLPPAPNGAKWAPTPRVVTRLSYRRDRSGYRASGYRHLFVVDANGGTPRQITSGDYDHSSGEWTPDGKELVFSGKRFEDADWKRRQSDIYAVNVETGEFRNITDFDGSEGGPQISPDGKLIAFSTSPNNTDTYNVSKLEIIGIDGTGRRALATDLDRRISTVTWADDSKSLYFTAQSHGRSHAYHLTLDDQRKQLTSGMAQFRLSDVGTDGTLYGTWTTPKAPGDIAVVRPGEHPQRLTKVNDDILHGVALGEVEEIWYDSVDDFKIQGWIVKPPQFDPSKKYPLILQIHGGPHSMYGVNFDFERQNHAANGYVVLYTNPRGSTGYGKDFGNAIDNAYPDKDFHDLMEGVDEVIDQGYIDPEQLFVYGGSGGGVLTCWIVGHTDRFAGAVSMYPVTNWISFVGTTDGPSWYYNFDQLPWEDIDEHWRRSPLKYVGNVTTPTMMLCGELDLRTPMAQTEEYYQALKLRKVDTVMVRVPDEYHGAAGRHLSNRLRRILYVRGWFDKYRDQAAAVEAVSRDGDK